MLSQRLHGTPKRCSVAVATALLRLVLRHNVAEAAGRAGAAVARVCFGLRLVAERRLLCEEDA